MKVTRFHLGIVPRLLRLLNKFFPQLGRSRLRQLFYFISIYWFEPFSPVTGEIVPGFRSGFYGRFQKPEQKQRNQISANLVNGQENVVRRYKLSEQIDLKRTSHIL